MKKITLTICILLVSILCFAGKLVLIHVTETNDLVSLFNNSDLKIHYYCDDYVLATAKILNYENAVIVDENAFAEVSSYAIVYCYEHYKKEYASKVSESNKILYSGNNFFIMKILSNDFKPAENDGMIAVSEVEARLPKQMVTYPVITETNEDVLEYMSQVSADRMLADIQILQDFLTRDAQHPNIFYARNFIKEQYDALNLEVTLHNFPYYNNDNVIAIQYGTEFPDEYVVCGAHYDSWCRDSYEIAPGADDNASGTAGIIETARILSQYDFKRSIIYCAFSAEEWGLIGSGYYAKQCANQNMNIVGYFNLDMIGYLPPETEFHIDLVHFLPSQKLADYYINICDIYFPGLSVEYYYPSYGSSDFASFNNMGYMAIFPHEIYFSNHYIHTLDDTIHLSVNSPESMELFTRTNIASIATLAMYEKAMPPNPVVEYYPNYTIYPNPTNGILTIESGELPIENIEIFDFSGKKQPFHLQSLSTSIHQINISHFPDGIYIIKISNEFAGKIIKKYLKYFSVFSYKKLLPVFRKQ